MSSPMPNVTTNYPGGEPTVFIGPDFRQVGIDRLVSGASAIATLQQQVATMEGQIADLTARVTALESAASPPA